MSNCLFVKEGRSALFTLASMLKNDFFIVLNIHKKKQTPFFFIGKWSLF
jgi:hypothetical protein